MGTETEWRLIDAALKFYAAFSQEHQRPPWVSEIVPPEDPLCMPPLLTIKMESGTVAVRPIESEGALVLFRKKLPQKRFVLICVGPEETHEQVRINTYSRLKKVHKRRKAGRSHKFRSNK